MPAPAASSAASRRSVAHRSAVRRSASDVASAAPSGGAERGDPPGGTATVPTTTPARGRWLDRRGPSASPGRCPGAKAPGAIARSSLTSRPTPRPARRWSRGRGPGSPPARPGPGPSAASSRAAWARRASPVVDAVLAHLADEVVAVRRGEQDGIGTGLAVEHPGHHRRRRARSGWRSSTDPPRVTVSLAMAATVWLLPLPGGPEMATIGSCRARRTASTWLALSGNGVRTGSASAAGVGRSPSAAWRRRRRGGRRPCRQRRRPASDQWRSDASTLGRNWSRLT